MHEKDTAAEAYLEPLQTSVLLLFCENGSK